MAGPPATSPGSSCTCKEQVPPWHFPLQEHALWPHMSSEGLALAALDLQERGSLGLELSPGFFVLVI